jgi:hypothetical protein
MSLSGGSMTVSRTVKHPERVTRRLLDELNEALRALKQSVEDFERDFRNHLPPYDPNFFSRGVIVLIILATLGFGLQVALLMLLGRP